MGVLSKGIQTLMNHKIEVVVLYLIHLFYGLMSGIGYHSELVSAIGDSAIGDTLQYGYDSTTMTDLMTQVGFDMGNSQSTSLVLLPLFLLLSVWIQGGVIATITTGTYGLRSTLSKGASYFVKNLITSLIGLSVVVFVWAIIWGVLFAIIGNPMEMNVIYNEKVLFLLMLGLLVLSLVLTVITVAWMIKAKSYTALDVEKPRITAFRWIRTHLPLVLFIAVFLFLMVLISVFVFTSLMKYCSFTSWSGVVLSLVLGQCMIITLCKLRVIFIGCLVHAE